MSERLPVLWSQTATRPDILEAPPPAEQQPHVPPARLQRRRMFRVVPPERMIDGREWWFGNRPRGPLPPSDDAFWWRHAHVGVETLAAILVVLLVLFGFAELVS